ncbi:SagB/ThcOx family dehydrogenase [Natronosalvus rutilus]|uniref:SagB/ThcOx family dehydrogenase n=1 Tax=Natronosalvus rutilus TaxID=2953753 RepID=A0A9E7N639_9EURY|nr:SagB/ThcOx family dehydrogenase [Natronosalvus rutilus]UTF52245.1 SagB/ThcOx family dehydrogenase [Natronosalvus rutilus]
MVSALEYHERTKHSPKSVQESGHRLDFDNKPRPFKRYENLSRRALSERVRVTGIPALSAITPTHADFSHERAVDLDALTALSYFSTGITKQLTRQGRELLFRAAACTGALYHVDLYAVCGDLADLKAGVYHVEPQSLSLDVLREGDYRGVLAAASDHDGVATAPVTFVATSTWWRNAWKYRDRTYRHAFWDSGTVLANLLATADSLSLPAEVVLGFADESVVELLGVDPRREAPLELVPVGAGNRAPDAPTLEPIDPTTAALSPEEKEFPLVHEAWRASTLESGDAVREWRSIARAQSVGQRKGGDGDRIELDPVNYETESKRPLHATIRRRGSCRAYEREPVSFRKFSTVLDRATRGVPFDGRESDASPLQFVDAYVLVNGVDDVPPGAYHYHPEAGEFERLIDGECREEAAHLALDQRLGGEAAACVYFLTDLEAVVDRLGNRGYRLAQLEAAVTAGRCYLATYAYRDLGGTGLTFYDDRVTSFLSPRADGQTPMFLYTFGKPE